MLNPDTKWLEKAKQLGSKLARDVLDQLVAADRGAWKDMTSGAKRHVLESAVNKAMAAITQAAAFVAGGVSDFYTGSIKSVAAEGGKSLKITLLVPEDQMNTVMKSLGKQVVVSLLPVEGFETARDQLREAIYRRQADFVDQQPESEETVVSALDEPASEEETDGDKAE